MRGEQADGEDPAGPPPPRAPAPSAPVTSLPEGPARPADHNGTTDALVVFLAMTAAGPLLGLLWAAAQPRLNVAAALTGQEGAFDAQAGIDTYFAMITGVGGVVGGVLAWWRARHGGPLVAVALAAGGAAGSLLAGLVGHEVRSSAVLAKLPPRASDLARELIDVRVRAHGFYTVYPVAALTIFAVLLWRSGRLERPAARQEADLHDGDKPDGGRRDDCPRDADRHDGGRQDGDAGGWRPAAAHTGGWGAPAPPTADPTADPAAGSTAGPGAGPTSAGAAGQAGHGERLDRRDPLSKGGPPRPPDPPGPPPGGWIPPGQPPTPGTTAGARFTAPG